MLVVDAANVIGSRPTGWWRDRPGAARLLVARLRATVTASRLPAPVIVVLEGAARRGVPEECRDGVRVVHAPGSGDDAIVQILAERGGPVVSASEDAMPPEQAPVVVVTADRGLRRRVTDLGAEVAGPTWLLERLGDESGLG
jgi:hypothetical protein